MPQKIKLSFSHLQWQKLSISVCAMALGQRPLETIYDALRCVGLATFARRKYSDLSGGEQQRVQLARVSRPRSGTPSPRRPSAVDIFLMSLFQVLI